MVYALYDLETCLSDDRWLIESFLFVKKVEITDTLPEEKVIKMATGGLLMGYELEWFQDGNGVVYNRAEDWRPCHRLIQLEDSVDDG